MRIRLPQRVAVTAAGLLGLAACGLGGSPRPTPTTASPTGAPSSIVSDGRTIPFGGVIPWGDTTIRRSGDRSFTVYADSDSAPHPNWCDRPQQERVRVTETASEVRIAVDGYAMPLAPGLACGGTGHVPQPKLITLAAPLGDRALVDASDGARHRVLDVSTLPVITRVPAGYVEQPVIWDEASDLVERNWSRTQPGGRMVGIGFMFGTQEEINSHGIPNEGKLAPIRIGSVPADVWSYRDLYNVVTILQWNLPTGGKAIRVSAYGSPRLHLTTADVIAAARSIR